MKLAGSIASLALLESILYPSESIRTTVIIPALPRSPLELEPGGDLQVVVSLIA